MSLQTRLMDDLKEAMRRRDELPRSVIRLMRAAIQEEQIDKRAELDDAGVIEVLSRMARRYRESIEQFGQANRQDLVAREEAEQAVLMKYLPQQLSREEDCRCSEPADCRTPEVLGNTQLHALARHGSELQAFS